MLQACDLNIHLNSIKILKHKGLFYIVHLFSDFSGLDNKVTVYSLALAENVSTQKKTVGTHTSYMSCCTFPNSDQQVCCM